MNTPLTDAAAFDRDEDCSVPDNEVVTAEFARYLEVQLNAEKAAVAYWTQKWNEQTASRDRALEELAYLKLQRDKLLEITWLDTPSEPHESTKRWAEEFEKGWMRRPVRTCLCCLGGDNLLEMNWPQYPGFPTVTVCGRCKADGSLQKWITEQIIRDNPEVQCLPTTQSPR